MTTRIDRHQARLHHLVDTIEREARRLGLWPALRPVAAIEAPEHVLRFSLVPAARAALAARARPAHEELPALVTALTYRYGWLPDALPLLSALRELHTQLAPAPVRWEVAIHAAAPPTVPWPLPLAQLPPGAAGALSAALDAVEAALRELGMWPVAPPWEQPEHASPETELRFSLVPRDRAALARALLPPALPIERAASDLRYRFGAASEAAVLLAAVDAYLALLQALEVP